MNKQEDDSLRSRLGGRVRTEGPERDFAIATLGVDADITPSLTAFAEYMIQAGQSNYFGQSVQAGLKIGF